MKIRIPTIQWRTINISVEPKVEPKVETRVIEKVVEKIVEPKVVKPKVEPAKRCSAWSLLIDGVKVTKPVTNETPMGTNAMNRNHIGHPVWEKLHTWMRTTGRSRAYWEKKYSLYGAKFRYACEQFNHLPPFTEKEILDNPNFFKKYLDKKTAPKPNGINNGTTNGYAHYHA